MIKTLTNQVIALAGLTQAVYSVQQIARRGNVDDTVIRPCIGSLLKIDAEDVLDVYGGLPELRTGLNLLEKQLGSPDKVDSELSRYSATLLFLERKLIKSPKQLELITGGVRTISELTPENDLLDDNILERLAELYQQTISELKPRVIVVGEERHLRSTGNANRIRSLLLAGIRSAVLWRQCGGSRWRLLLSRGKLQRETRRLLQT
jgi:high frequency lysogenization protein